MSIKNRFALVLGLLLAGFGGAVSVIRLLERGQLQEIRAESAIERGMVLDRWLEITSRKWDAQVVDFAQSEEWVRLVEAGGAEPRKRLLASLSLLDAQAAWLVRPDGSIVIGAAAGEESVPSLPVPASDFTRSAGGAPTARFFAADSSGLLEFATAPVRRDAEPPRAWLLVARRWDETRLRLLGGLAEGKLSLEPAGTVASSPPAARVTLTRPLNDMSGRPLRELRADFPLADFPEIFSGAGSQVWVFISFGLLVILALALGLQAWVLRPLAQVGASLRAGDPAPLSALRGEQNELGQVARLVESSFAQRDALQREIAERTRAEASLRKSEETLRRTLEERTRLGRNLHDGVIQSLYAAGMGLAGIRVLLHPDQEDAATRLEQTRRVLNGTVGDLRSFIAGLEPESVREQSFTQATSALLDFMRSIRPVEATLAIDEVVAASLSLEERAQALQIAREAVSNALRHGEASEIRVSLQAAGTGAIFTIRDNGRGFDTSSRAAGHGLGLDNLAARARELGARLHVKSQPGEGTQVTLIINPSDETQ